MGYLNNSVVTVDAILTKKGRELLATNDGSFLITQFALADDEIDYTLYNPTHPSGSAYYGEALENMPLLEAFPNETQIMKYKLVTLPRGTSKMPVLDLGYSAVTLQQGASLSITPQTLNYIGGNQTYETSGYTAIISDVRLLNTFNGVGIDTPAATAANSTTTLGTNVSKTVVGTTINLTATTVNTLFGGNTQLQATLTVTGRDSGARLTIPVTVTRQGS
mgnify:FL=1|jgi:hypothetical protein|tara:strand:- start:1267 stop:1926 length:660 start_codon:yes stop_codon:yes gene_type:complete